METAVEEEIATHFPVDRIASYFRISNGISGVIVADKNGLVIGSGGTLKETTEARQSTQPSIASMGIQLITLATQIDPGSKTVPSVGLSGEHNKLGFTKENDLVIVLHVKD